MNEFAKLFHYNSVILRTFPILAHHMSDVELISQNYFVGPKTEDRICSHTTAIFEMLDGVINEVFKIDIAPLNKVLSSYCNSDYMFISMLFLYLART